MRILNIKCFIFIFLGMVEIVHAQNLNFDILQGDKKKIVSFDYTHNFILIEARFNQQIPVKFIYDTGAEHTLLFNKEITDLLGIKYDRRIKVIGSDLSTNMHALVCPQIPISIKDLDPRITDVVVLEEDFFHIDELTGVNIGGLIGGSFFRNYVVKFDYKRQEITLFHPKYFRTPNKKYTAFDIEIKAGKPYIKTHCLLQDGTTVETLLLLDTGAGLPLLLHNNSSDMMFLPPDIIEGKLGMGLGGYVKGYLGRVNAFYLGEYKFENIITSFQNLDSTFINNPINFRNGLIGNQILSRFEMILDYNNKKMYLKPIKKYNKSFDVDRSGLVIFAYGPKLNQFIVQDVLANSPADKIGIKKGDLITKINGMPTSILDLHHVSSRFYKKEGKSIRLRISRNGIITTKNLILKDLI